MGEALFIGLTLTAIAIASWSIAPALVSRAAQRDPGFNPLVFNGWRMLFALAATLPLALVTGYPYNTPWLNIGFQAGVIVGGVVSTILGDTLFAYSISRIGSSLAMPVSYLFVVWTALIDYIQGAAGPMVFVSAAMALAGVWLAYQGHTQRDPRGLLAAIATSLVWAASSYGYHTAVSIVQELSGAGLLEASLSVAATRAIYTVAVMAPLLPRWTPRRTLVETLGSSLAGFVVGAIAFIAALGVLPVSYVSIALSANPITVQVFAHSIAGEAVTKRTAAGAALVAVAIALLSYNPTSLY